MVNELIEALAQGPLVETSSGAVCPWCGSREGFPAPEDFLHVIDCPVSQARLLVEFMEKNMTEVIG